MSKLDVVILGGGVAGLAAAWSLGRRLPNASLLLLEREPHTFRHSSGRNAAIYRPLETSPTTTRLALGSRGLLRELEQDPPLQLRPVQLRQNDGLLLTAHSPEALTPLARVADAQQVRYRWLEGAELERRSSGLRGGECRYGLDVETGGTLNGPALATSLQQRVAARGVHVQTGACARTISRTGDRVSGVTLEDGRFLAADVVVIAAGAWSRALGESCACPLPLQPHRRHLALLQPEAELPLDPVTWSVDLGVYFRRWGSQVMACPGDHTAHAAAEPEVDPTALKLLRHKLRRVAPSLADLPFAEAWACLRTQTPDGEAVVGLDPRAQGLYWFAGLAGFGMSASLAASQLLADLIADPAKLDVQSAGLARTLDPARWLDATARSEETIANE